jgi:hypothetical protein
VRALRGHVDALAQGMERQDAAGWVLATVLTAWAEDHGLIPEGLRRGAGSDPAVQVVAGFAHLGDHPSTACLLDARYRPLTGLPPRRELAQLLAWWREQAPDLRNPAPASGPSSITGWLAADLLQALGGDRGDAAFCQTPWFVADLLCARTLAPAFAEHAQAPVINVIDPAAGAGHLLVWGALGLFEAYTRGAGGRRGLGPEDAVRALVTGVCGVELDPLSAAVARLRLTVLYGRLLAGDRDVRLREIPAWVRPRVAVGNALLAGLGDPHPPGTVVDDTAEYPGILARGTYHAVIANPPYRQLADPAVREAVRAAYPQVCKGRFPASVPFAQLLFDLAIRGG